MRKVIGQKAMRLLIEARLREHPEWSDNLIAHKLGCSDTTVKAVGSELEATSQIGKFDRLLGADGKWRKNRRKADAEPKPKTPRSDDSKAAKALALRKWASTPPTRPERVE